MKKIVSVTAFIMLSMGLTAQFKTVPQAEELSTSSPTIDFSLFKTKEAKNEEAINYSAYSNQTLDINKRSEFNILRKSQSGKVEWIEGRLNQDKSLALETRAYNWLQQANTTLGFKNNEGDFRVRDIFQDNSGERHIKMDQYLNGIRVHDSEVILHTQDGNINLLNGAYIFEKEIDLDISVALSFEQAKKIVEKQLTNYHTDLNKLKHLGVKIPFDQWEMELVYFKFEELYVPCYHIEVYPNLGEHFTYFIHSGTGEILRKYSNICKMHHDHGDHQNCTPPDGPRVTNAGDLFGLNRTINTYEVGNNFFMIDGSRDMFNLNFSNLPDEPVGAIWTIDLNNTSPINEDAQYTHVVSSDNNWAASPEGVSAHFNAGRAYTYFKETFNRESISGDGQNIISFVNVADENGSSLGNAFWNGLGIYYGNGSNEFFALGRGLDVAGHEMSHGVVQATANLEYFGESGAMNESFADIFGAMIDREDWLIGEDVVRNTAFPSGALRNMMDPHNGAQTGDFARGWQPKHVDEKFNGPEDNNGVHINSGIPNHAFYLFADAVGRDKAEQVFYRALTSYLTRSSGFNELRFAVIRAVEDLYGSTELNAARSAFDQVGITDESEGDFEQDIDVNPGQDLLLVSDQAKSNLLLFDIATGEPIFDPLTDIDQLSKPSVTDDGSRIVFVGTDNHIYLIELDWSVSPPTGGIFQVSTTPDWRNVVISKDGNRLALLDKALTNEIIVLDVPSNSQVTFELTNPTYTEGVETGEVLYADAMEFDISSNVLIYDAINRVNSNNSGTLEFWDIGFLEVWNPAADTWALGRIDKLFGSLPEGISIGNPTFSKNSPFIIAMDYLEGQNFSILGYNIETGDLNEVIPNATIGYPNYSRDDRFLIYDFDFLGYTDLAIVQLNDDKISRVINSDDIFGPNFRWGVWFGNGSRLSTSTQEVIQDESVLKVIPNPTNDIASIQIDIEGASGSSVLMVFDQMGRRVSQQRVEQTSGNLELNVSNWTPGMYIVQVMSSELIYQTQFVKQ